MWNIILSRNRAMCGHYWPVIARLLLPMVVIWIDLCIYFHIFVIGYRLFAQSIAQFRKLEQLYDRVSRAKDTTAATSGTQGRCLLAADAAIVLVMLHFARYCPLPSRCLVLLGNESFWQTETTTQRNETTRQLSPLCDSTINEFRFDFVIIKRGNYDDNNVSISIHVASVLNW